MSIRHGEACSFFSNNVFSRASRLQTNRIPQNRRKIKKTKGSKGHKVNRSKKLKRLKQLNHFENAGIITMHLLNQHSKVSRIHHGGSGPLDQQQ
jgi:hypothetical protein